MARSASRHRRADGLPDRYSFRIEVLEAEDVDAEKIRRHALPMERVDAACAAEEVSRRHGVETIFDQRFLPTEQSKLALVDPDHQRVLASADRAIALRQLGEVGIDLERNGPAMAGAAIGLQRPDFHSTVWLIDISSSRKDATILVFPSEGRT